MKTRVVIEIDELELGEFLQSLAGMAEEQVFGLSDAPGVDDETGEEPF